MARTSDGAAFGQALTPHERRIVLMVANGAATPEISRTLYMADSTVKTHLRRVSIKLGAHSRAQVVALALRHKEIYMTELADGTPHPTPATVEPSEDQAQHQP